MSAPNKSYDPKQVSPLGAEAVDAAVAAALADIAAARLQTQQQLQAFWRPLGAIAPAQAVALRLSTSATLVAATNQDLDKAVDEGRFGKITLADAYIKWFRTQQYYDQGGWRGTWKLDGGGALIVRGLTPGPDVAKALQQVQRQWVEEDFPDAKRVAEIADQIVSKFQRARQ